MALQVIVPQIIPKTCIDTEKMSSSSQSMPLALPLSLHTGALYDFFGVLPFLLGFFFFGGGVLFFPLHVIVYCTHTRTKISQCVSPFSVVRCDGVGVARWGRGVDYPFEAMPRQLSYDRRRHIRL